MRSKIEQCNEHDEFISGPEREKFSADLTKAKIDAEASQQMNLEAATVQETFAANDRVRVVGSNNQPKLNGQSAFDAGDRVRVVGFRGSLQNLNGHDGQVVGGGTASSRAGRCAWTMNPKSFVFAAQI